MRTCRTISSNGTGTTTFTRWVTNASTAWLYGASAVNCSLLGIGERTGNCPLEAMAMEYAALRGTMDGMDFTAITEIADYFEREINYIVPPQDAFCGPRFQFHPRGHPCGRASEGRGDLQHLRYGEDPQPSPRASPSTRRAALRASPSGSTTIYSLPDEYKVTKNDPLVVAMKERVDAEYEEGRNSSFGDDELVNLIYSIDSKRIRDLNAHSMR